MNIDNQNLELYENLAFCFRQKTFNMLQETLKSMTKLNDSEVDEICSEFLVEFCSQLDLGEWKVEDSYFRPIVSFISGEDLQKLDQNTRLIMPYEAYQYHDKVWEEVEEYNTTS